MPGSWRRAMAVCPAGARPARQGRNLSRSVIQIFPKTFRRTLNVGPSFLRVARRKHQRVASTRKAYSGEVPLCECSARCRFQMRQQSFLPGTRNKRQEPRGGTSLWGGDRLLCDLSTAFADRGSVLRMAVLDEIPILTGTRSV